jgi:hypothetical protein
MGNRLQYLRRGGIAAAAALVLGASGCALPNGSTGGDPLLGNFNRPIVPTPPPERGGLGLDSPAYDAGARIGVTSPDVPTPVENSPGGQSLPQLTSPSLFSGTRMPFSGGADEPFVAGKQMGSVGARLPSSHEGPGSRLPMVPTYGRTSADSVTMRPKDSTYQPSDTTAPVRLVSHEALKDPARVSSIEEGQALLQTAGASGLKSEQLSGGEWAFGCTVGAKSFQAHGRDPLDAMKQVLIQVQKER